MITHLLCQNLSSSQYRFGTGLHILGMFREFSSWIEAEGESLEASPCSAVAGNPRAPVLLNYKTLLLSVWLWDMVC